MAQGLSLFGGLAKGFALGRQQKIEREREAEMNDLKKQAAKVQMEAQKVALEEAKRKNKLVDLLMVGQSPQGAGGGQGAPGQTPAFSENFSEEAFQAGTGQSMVGEPPAPTQQPPGLTENLALGQMMKNPQMVALLEMAGIPIGGAARLAESQTENQWGRTVDLARLNQKSYIDGVGPNGQPAKIEVDKFGTPTGRVLPLPVEMENVTIEEPGGVKRQERFPKYGQRPSLQISPKKPKSAESAGKIATARGAIPSIQEIRSTIIGPDGKVDRSVVGQMQTNMPWSTGRMLNASFKEALDAKSRAMTGAAMTPNEESFYMALYRPSFLDSDELIKDKLNRMEAFMTGYLEELAPGETAKDVFPLGGRQFKLVPAGEKGGPGKRKLSREKAAEILQTVEGDKDRARALASEMGYEF